MIRAIVGANWGDEGKGKITDMLAAQSDIVIRFQGGANAGHTIINEYGRFALHLLPSGACYPNTVNILGNGVALDIPKLIHELEDVKSRGVNPQILVSDRAQIMMPYHVQLDTYEEERLGAAAFGSTKSGIAPFFSDKFAKIGVQVNELFFPEELREKLERVVALKNLQIEHIYHKPLIDVDELFDTLMQYKTMIEPYVTDTVKYLREAIAEGKTILLEGQLGTLKDPDFGIYPMVTSSSPLASYGAIGAGIPARLIEDVVVVTKAYDIPKYLKLTPVGLNKDEQYSYERYDCFHKIQYLPDEIKDLDLFPRFNANRYEQQLSAVYEELKKNKRTKDLKGLYK